MSDYYQDLVSHADIESFAKEKVNIKADRIEKYRNQVNGVRDRIKAYIDETPDVKFFKTQLAGSLAKHTAISSISDVDIALYIKSDTEWDNLDSLLDYVKQKLRVTYPEPTPIRLDPPCVVIEFQGTGLDVEIMPVLDAGGNEGYGTIWDPSTLNKTYTSIPRHLEFLAKRRTVRSPHFAQVIRLLKYWKFMNDINFRSFVIELIAADLADSGTDFSNYPEALAGFFNQVANDNMETPIYFTDFFGKDKFPLGTSPPVEIWDPVTPDNNVTKEFSIHDRDTISDACAEASDVIAEARTTTRKGEAVQCWKKLFGPSFSA